MARMSLAVIMAGTALTTLAIPGHAQKLDPLFQSASQAVVPSLAASLPNGGIPLPAVNQVTGFGRLFDFGSSSSDTRSTVPVLPGYGDRWSNGNANYVELLSPLIGVTDRSGSTVPLASPTPTNFAQAGTTSVTALGQVTQFQAAYGHFAPNDVALMWSGINDWDGRQVTAANYQSIAATNLAAQTTMASELLALGARNLVVLGQVPFGTFQFFTTNLGAGQSDANAIDQGAALVDQGLLSNLETLHQQTGASIRLFDTTLLVNEIRANPTAYGFSVAGVQSGVNCFSLLGYTKASCPAGASFATQNQFLSWDGIHYTYRFHEVLAEAIANQELAPYTIAPQAEMAAAGSEAFSSNLLLRLDSYRGQSAAGGGPAAGQSRPFSVFLEGGYSNANRSAGTGTPGLDGDDAGSLTVGGEYRISQNILVGAAFNYASPSTNLDSLGTSGFARTDLTSYQIAGFASFNYPHWFADAAFGYGFDSYHTERTGIVDTLQSDHSGDTLFAAAKGAYLFDLGTTGVRAGPLGILSYDKVWVDRYTEAGDPLLAQTVHAQGADSLVGSVGVQVRRDVSVAGHVVSPFLNLTADRQFFGGRLSLITAQTYAPDLTVTTKVGGYGAHTYGQVATGASVDIGGGFSAMVNGAATFARAYGNDYLLNGGIKYSF